MMGKIFALFFMGLFASLASLFLKKATVNGLSVRKLLCNPYLYLGGILYIFSALLNIYLLKVMPYSTVVPLGSLTYIWTLVLSHRLLGEKITKVKLEGVLMILLGVTLVAMV